MVRGSSEVQAQGGHRSTARVGSCSCCSRLSGDVRLGPSFHLPGPSRLIGAFLKYCRESVMFFSTGLRNVFSYSFCTQLRKIKLPVEFLDLACLAKATCP
eukprot:1505794-Pyramimonas_sp.AAC.1